MRRKISAFRASRPPRHFEPVQFLFHLMKRIVADLVAGTHGENRLPCRVDSGAMEVAMCRARGVG